MKNLKRVLAIISIILLLGGILTICVLLFLSKNMSETVVRGLVSCLIALPIISYGYLILYRYANRYKNVIREEIDKLDSEESNKK